MLGTLASSLLTDIVLNKKSKGVICAGESVIVLVVDLKNFDSSPFKQL